MECLVFFIIICVVIASSAKKGNKNGPVTQSGAYRQVPPQQAQQQWAQQQQRMQQQQQKMQEMRMEQQRRQQQQQQQQTQQRVVTDAERARLEEYRRRKEGEPIRPSQPNYVSNHSRTVSQPNIVERAKKNIATIEKEQENVEVALAQPMDVKSKINHVETGPHSEVCIRAEHTEPTEETESMLGTVEDLMVMGYSGNLSGMRDFQAEADEMLSSYIL